MYECPNCGGGLRFDPAGQDLVCDYCQTRLDPYQYEKDHDADISEDAYGVQIFTCPQCGGEIMTTNISVTGFCSYCGASTVLDSRMAREKRPTWIIPFKKTGKDCREAYKKRIARAIYTPAGMRDETFMDSFRGIYIPYWVYNGKVDTRIVLKGTHVHRSGNYVITDHYDLGNDVKASYEGISYDASSSFSDDVSERIAPFSADALRDFTPSMLCGFYADTSDVPARLYADRARNLAERDVWYRISTDPGMEDFDLTPPDSAYKLESQIPMRSGGPKLALFPVWFATYRKDERVAYSVVNGLDGKIAVDLPVSLRRFLAGTLVLALPLFILLNMFLTISPPSVLALSSVLAAVSSFLYYREIKALTAREMRTDDLGYRTVVNGEKGGSLQMKKGKKPKKRKRAAGRSMGTIMAAAFIAVLFAGELAASAVSFFSSFMIHFAALAAVAVCSCLTLETCQEGQTGRVLPGILGTALAVLAGLGVRLLNPAADLWYYSASALSFAAIGFSLIQVIRRYNILATRPLPDFFNRKGGETGKAMLGLFLALSLAGLCGGNALASPATVYTNPSTGYSVYIDDGADLLSEDEEAQLSEAMKKVTEFGGAAFVSTASNPMGAVEYAQDSYYTLFGNGSGTLFLIDMDNRYLYLANDGYIYSVVNKGRSMTITDNVYTYAVEGDYLGCALAVYEQLNILLTGGRIAQPMKYISNLLLSLILSLMLNYLLVLLTAGSRKPSEDTILGAVRIGFRMSNPSAVMTHTTRVYDPPFSSSGGGGGSRGGGGGGGGFSGGGGGHSF